MNIEKLMMMQAGLDQHIETKHGLASENLVERKILALLVELGELANETRCFKFWSLRGPSERDVILAEYVDGIHFILSLANDHGFTLHVPKLSLAKGDVIEQFILIYQGISKFRDELTYETFEIVFNEYVRLGQMLGFSAMDIEQAYVSKNEVNYERQKQGY